MINAIPVDGDMSRVPGFGNRPTVITKTPVEAGVAVETGVIGDDAGSCNGRYRIDPAYLERCRRGSA